MSARSLGGSPTGADPGVLAGLSALALLAAVDAASGVQLTGAYAIGAIVASMLTVSRRTVAVAVVCVTTALLGGTWEGNLGSREWAVRALLCAVLATLAVVSAGLRDAREARLRRMTVIAETAQQAVLRAMPTAVGSVGFAARYVSASAEALVGGDLYEVAATPYGVRVIVGDVRGKGLEAVRTAAAVLGAFRQAAFVEPDPAALARQIDDTVARMVDDEEFVTAVIAEFRDGEVSVANCGHHPPLLVADRSIFLVDDAEPTLPLGLGAAPTLQRHRWPAGARLLLYTDGLVEARDPRGEFFPLADHAPTLAGGTLGESLDGLVQRLLSFSGSMEDDLALVLAENRALGVTG